MPLPSCLTPHTSRLIPDASYLTPDPNESAKIISNTEITRRALKKFPFIKEGWINQK
jgi:hypothetical protein